MRTINAVIFDYGLTIGAEYYFNVRPPDVPDWDRLVQATAFEDKDFNHAWMLGRTDIRELARRLAAKTGMTADAVMEYLRLGCRQVKEFPQVIGLVRQLAGAGMPLAMVTVNFDIFDQVVVPWHQYDRLFRSIINSANHDETDKTRLWPLAFRDLGPGIGYHNSLLIEDRLQEVERFRQLGGAAIQFRPDTDLAAELQGYCFQPPEAPCRAM